MTRVIHTGDTHIGYRQYHRPERREDFLDAFRQVIEDAIDQNVDAVVHAGDLFNDRRPGLLDLRGSIDILEDLRAAEIPFLAIVGNHEDARDGQWIDLFEQLGLATHLDNTGTVVGNTTFYGLDHVPRAKRATLEYDFEPPETEFSALVAHGLFEPFPHGDWDLEEILSRATVNFDGLLLGDDHTPNQIQVEGTWATYCGSTERTSASQREPRGYNLVTFDEDVSITRRDIGTRDFVFIDLELGPSEGDSLVRERIRETDVDDAVVIVTIEGAGDSIPPADIEAVGDSEGALVTRVNDRRDVDSESEMSVSFVDPDDAVTNRVRELGLSDAARSVESLIRDEDLAKSNIRNRVVETVTETLDDPSAFESATMESEPDTEPNDAEEPTETGETVTDETAEDPAEADGPTETTMGDFL
ncbi:DNA double-strand break repair protein Mre11 [Halodesulfurarchaeum sp.]|uniref:DNA double-strand break repair protein Mre11 n=1 Tax=Halodesulfurarchaeum sp. TaxID=1980530 RepID=UPI002FC37A97